MTQDELIESLVSRLAWACDLPEDETGFTKAGIKQLIETTLAPVLANDAAVREAEENKWNIEYCLMDSRSVWVIYANGCDPLSEGPTIREAVQTAVTEAKGYMDHM